MDRSSSGTAPFTRRVLIVVGIVTLAVIGVLSVWYIAHVLLLLFAAGLFAVLLEGLARPLQRHLRMPRPWAVLLVTLVLFGLLILGIRLGGVAVADQIYQLTERLPEALAQLEKWLRRYPWGRALLEWAGETSPPKMPVATQLLGRVTGVFSTAIGGLANVGLILIIGFYLALDPQPYRRGLLYLLPHARRERADRVLQATAHALRWWLVGRAAAMTVVGVLTAVGLWLIGVPLVLALGVIAGLLSFVPFIGPILSAIPAILVGLIGGPMQAAYVVLVFVVVQLLESNFITPIIQGRTVSLPPAALLSAQVILGVLFGILGLLLATPLLVVLIVLVQMLYIQGMLGDPVPPLGQR